MSTSNSDDDNPVVDVPKLRHLDLASIHQFVVMLSFNKDGTNYKGSAFFVVIPDSPYEVIFTAGHNLYTQTKNFATDVILLLPNPNPTSAIPISIPISPEQIKVAADYVDDPTKHEDDYGVILLPWNGKQPRRGLGFKMTHAFSELRGEANVSCYRDRSLPGRPVMSTGLIVVDKCTENQLMYNAKTEGGNSGSPVWIADVEADEVVVVAVHNLKTEPGSLGSRGSRLSPKLLREVYGWVGLDTKKKIRAQNISKTARIVLPPSGLYVTFEGSGFARLQRGTGTEFDVLPAQVASAISTSGTIRYALAVGEQWVKFSVENQQAILVDKLVESCLFVKQTMKNPLLKPHIAYIGVEEKYFLKMDGSKFQAHDPPSFRRSGISLMTSNTPITFEPYIPFSLLVTPATEDAKADSHSASECCPACGHVFPCKAS